MRMKKLMLLFLAAIVAGSTAAQPMMPIPADEAVRTGTLENGMTYYIRHNEKPKGQADFYILHDVGAIQEDDNQQGLAHFLEPARLVALHRPGGRRDRRRARSDLRGAAHARRCFVALDDGPDQGSGQRLEV